MLSLRVGGDSKMRTDSIVTVVVPLVPAHDRFVPQLIAQLVQQREPIERVILARSSARSRNMEPLMKSVSALRAKHDIQIEVSATRRQQLAGQNRNRGWDQVGTTFTAFLDADDEYSENRLAHLVEVALSEESDLVLHDFLLKDSDSDSLLDDTFCLGDLLRTPELFDATFPDGRNRSREGKQPGDTNINIPPNATKHQTVHHGHVLVRTSLRQDFRYGNLYPGEDGQFCRDVLWAKRQVTYVPAKLSAYRPGLSAEASASVALRTRRKLTRFAEFSRVRA